MLETKARKILGYEGKLTIKDLTAFMTSEGHGLFATIKASIGSMGSLKTAFKSIASNFHPDKAIAQGFDKESKMYILYNKIFIEAVEARKSSTSLGEFVQKIGGKEIAPEHQMWYDYLIRKASGEELREAETRTDRLVG